MSDALSLGDIQVPDMTQVDTFLALHCGNTFPACDITVEKEAEFETRMVTKQLADGQTVQYEQQVATADPILTGFGSSEIKDADGDEFHHSALKSLCDPAETQGMSTWIGHKMELPEKFIGQLVVPPEITTGTRDDFSGAIRPMKDDWAGVRLKSRVEMENPPAAQLYKFIQKGARFGWSVGCAYTKYRRKNDGRGAVKGYDVFEAKPIEWSIVGVPSNQQSWVEVTRKFLVMKGVLPADENDPEVAIVFKHWDEFGTMSPKIRAFAEELFNTYGLLLAEPATGKRMSWPGR